GCCDWTRFSMRRKIFLLCAGLLAIVGGYWFWSHQTSADWMQQVSPEQRHAFAEIVSQGGRVRNEVSPGGPPGITVSFFGPRITDESLASLRGPAQIETLFIHETHVAGGGLAHLAGQPELRSLSLLDTKVADASLAPIEGLSQLRELVLAGT